MNTGLDAKDLCVDLLSRSQCKVQVAAVLEDSHGVYSWGWNSPGNGYGLHAEVHCLRRSNRRRWGRSTLYVAARRFGGQKVVTARPCEGCQRFLGGIKRVVFRDSSGEWKDFP